MQISKLLFALGTLALTATSKPLPIEKRQNSSALKGLSMRIQPLGASITFGTGSTDGNGYRLDLLNNLHPPASVTYIGSVKHGNMSNNENEGHPGFRIDQVAGQAPKSTGQRPNVITLDAGLNDVVQNFNLSGAPARLGALIDQLHAACPDAVIVVANLFTNTNETFLERIKAFNAGIPAQVAKRADAGVHVIAADMFAAVTKDDLFTDGEHPNDTGYVKMAKVWYNAIVTAANKGWIGKPVTVS